MKLNFDLLHFLFAYFGRKFEVWIVFLFVRCMRIIYMLIIGYKNNIWYNQSKSYQIEFSIQFKKQDTFDKRFFLFYWFKIFRLWFTNHTIFCLRYGNENIIKYSEKWMKKCVHGSLSQLPNNKTWNVSLKCVVYLHAGRK